MEEPWRIELFGGLRAIRGERILTHFETRKTSALLACLALRPLPTTNFSFLSTVSWDGKDTSKSPNPVICKTATGIVELTRGAIIGRQTGASMVAADGHVYAPAEMSALVDQIARFMSSTFTAQNIDKEAGPLSDDNAACGIFGVMNQSFYFGINDFLEGDLAIDANGNEVLSGKPFDPVIFRQYKAWKNDPNRRRASIARGATLFNSPRLTINDVGGLNEPSITLPDGREMNRPTGPIITSCGACHNTPGAGSHSTRLLLNIGLADKAPAFLGRKSVADLPLFYLRSNKDGRIIQTTDPGRAVITGKFAHIGQFKVPSLRGLAARAPYFHNGAAATLEDLVEYYNAHYASHFTAREKADLVAFLKTL